MPNGSDIIIIGGSVEVEFDSRIYIPEGISAEGRGRHKSNDVKLIRVRITDDVGEVRYDSGENPTGTGLKWTIHASGQEVKSL